MTSNGDRTHRHYIAPSTSSSSTSIRSCCCCLLLLLTLLALVLIAIVLFVALGIRPKKPSFDLNTASISYLLLQSPPQSSSAAYLTLNLTLLFTAVNPNKLDIRYDNSLFYVMYHGVPLGVASVPGFEQPAHSTRLVRTAVSVSRFDVMQADAADLVRDAAVNDRVELSIAGDVGARVRVFGITSPKVQVAVDCAIAISPTKQSLTYKQCGVDGLNV